MAVPESIRNVERPTNTVVVDNKKDGPNRWAVRERAFVRYIPGKKNPQPHCGKTIGHIIDGKYVPVLFAPTKGGAGSESSKTELYDPGADFLEYGFPALLNTVVDDIKDDLLRLFHPRQVYDIIAIAMLRIQEKDAIDSQLKSYYESSFVSVFWPGACLSSKPVHDLEVSIGKNMERRADFAKLRLERVAADHHIAVDGMLTQDNSSVNDLAEFAGKSRVKGRMELSILYAYDIELGEPICAEVFPGNNVDCSTYVPFIQHNHITKGILVDDKGFPPSKLQEILKGFPDLHFLTPIKRNDSRIAEYNMLQYQKPMDFDDNILYYSKAQTKDGHYLYAFLDSRRAFAENMKYGADAIKNDDFDPEKYAEKAQVFGLIVFESDIDMKPELAYQTYDNRWKLEMIFKEYKSALQLDVSYVHSDYSVIGSEFINFIAVLMTSRITEKMRKVGLLACMSYREVARHLKKVWRKLDAPEPMTADGYWVHTLEKDYAILELLGLSKQNPKVHIKPIVKKEKEKSDNSTNAANKSTKKGTKNSNKASSSAKSAESAVQQSVEKNKGGRPRIHPPKDPNEPKRPRGRPRIYPPKDPNAPKRPRGRPRKEPPSTEAPDVEQKPP